MERHLSIVLSKEENNYRRLAQKHWGLTDEQMAGMHVHHFPPKSQGGRNVPEHLYVCSESIHHYGWHNASIGLVPWASAAGKSGGSVGGNKTKSLNRGIHTPYYQGLTEEGKRKKSASGKAGGLKSGKLKTEKQTEARKRNSLKGLESITREMRIANGEKTGKPVMCVETGQVWKSRSEAQRETGVYNISKCCRGVQKTAGGYHWRYA